MHLYSSQRLVWTFEWSLSCGYALMEADNSFIVLTQVNQILLDTHL